MEGVSVEDLQYVLLTLRMCGTDINKTLGDKIRGGDCVKVILKSMTN